MNNVLTISAVIELNAGEFTDQEYSFPDGSGEENPDGWKEYWKNSIKDAGLTKVDQLITGVPMIDVTTIDDDEIRIIVEAQLKDSDLNDDDDILTFEGGVVVQYGDSSIIPQCCTSISDYKQWYEIVQSQPKEWTQIWIGHPWIFARVKEGRLEFSDYSEKNEWDEVGKLSIDLVDFKAKFDDMIKGIKKFKSRVEVILLSNGVANSAQVSEILVNKLN